jgi:aminoglycoside 6-adenylyltransferase
LAEVLNFAPSGYNIHMLHRENAIETLQSWAEEQDSVVAMILTGSRANPSAVTDIFSDYDIQLFVTDIEPYMNDEWLSYFGNVMIKWPLTPMSTFDKNWITRLVLFDSGVRIDFQITAKKVNLKVNQVKANPMMNVSTILAGP